MHCITAQNNGYIPGTKLCHDVAHSYLATELHIQVHQKCLTTDSQELCYFLASGATTIYSIIFLLKAEITNHHAYIFWHLGWCFAN